MYHIDGTRTIPKQPSRPPPKSTTLMSPNFFSSRVPLWRSVPQPCSACKTKSYEDLMRILGMPMLPGLTEYHCCLTQCGAKIRDWFNWSSNEVRNPARLSRYRTPYRGAITQSSSGCLIMQDPMQRRRIFKESLH